MSDDPTTLLAEVLAAINTYDPLMFTDQHRELFERAAAQPPPSVPAGADVAAVLGGLVEEMDALADELQDRSMRSEMLMFKAEQAAGVRQARSLVWAAQQKAATGARAAGGEPLEVIRELIAMTAQPSDKWHHALAWGQRWDSMILRAHAVLAAAQPAPASTGVAELLAECRDLIERRGDVGAVIRCDEIVRLLAPEGGQS